MVGKKFGNFHAKSAFFVLAALILAACQTSSIDLNEEASHFVGDGNSPIKENVALADDEIAEIAEPETRKVIEWEIAINNSIMPPPEVKETIDKSCKKRPRRIVF